MKYQVYKRPDGKEEVRLKPESERDCHEIDECSQCLFENDHMCDDESGVDEFMDELTSRLFDPSLKLKKPPRRSQPSQELSLGEVLRQFGISGNIPQGFPNMNITNVEMRPFVIENGKVITDPETRELMRKAGILEKIEESFEEEDEN